MVLNHCVELSTPSNINLFSLDTFFLSNFLCSPVLPKSLNFFLVLLLCKCLCSCYANLLCFVHFT